MVRSSRANSGTALLLIAMLSAAFNADVSAHREDELLQAARIDVKSARLLVELDLTPGIAIAEAAITEIDRNGDGELSTQERQRYAERVLGVISLRIDGEPLRLSLASSSFPTVDALRSGQAAIRLRVGADIPTLNVGAHNIFFRNGNATANSVFLANALLPESDRIAVTRQLRDLEQRDLTVELTVRDTRLSSLTWVGVAGALMLGHLSIRRRRTEPVHRVKTPRS